MNLECRPAEASSSWRLCSCSKKRWLNALRPQLLRCSQRCKTAQGVARLNHGKPDRGEAPFLLTGCKQRCLRCPTASRRAAAQPDSAPEFESTSDSEIDVSTLAFYTAWLLVWFLHSADYLNFLQATSSNRPETEQSASSSLPDIDLDAMFVEAGMDRLPSNTARRAGMQAESFAGDARSYDGLAPACNVCADLHKPPDPEVDALWDWKIPVLPCDDK